ncbi:MAG: hypothetical protein H6707_20055 [Deltaproteobacteria bacterium]|nr:hypothetical protein [Deltaproteobacteria bacterium]
MLRALRGAGACFVAGACCAFAVGLAAGCQDAAPQRSSGNDAGVVDARASGDAGQDTAIVGDPTNAGCIRDRVELSKDPRCTCVCSDCDCRDIQCKCDAACYGDPSCPISADAAGTGQTGASWPHQNCELSCAPLSDLVQELVCSVNNCELKQQTLALDPQPTPAENVENLQRAAKRVDVLFVIDNSGSMADDQTAAACAMDGYFDAADAAGAAYQTGVISTDMEGKHPGATRTYDADGNFVGAPKLMGVNTSCTEQLSCQCVDGAPSGERDPPICTFNASGGWIDTSSADARRRLKQTVVQGSNGSNKEGPLEQAFRFFLDLEQRGQFAGPYEIVVISDEDADADDRLCPFNTVDRSTSVGNWHPPQPLNTQDSCKADLAAFYRWYFQSRGIVVHGVLTTDVCGSSRQGRGPELSSITLEVIQATGGHHTPICQCQDYQAFFASVGKTTGQLSTSLCLAQQPTEAKTIAVTYTEGGQSQQVPRSLSDGFSYDATTNCLTFHGAAWQNAMGSYRVSYQSVSGASSKACFPAKIDPLEQTIDVTCAGVSVPKDAQNGWRLDPRDDCLLFSGQYGDVKGPCRVSYL